MMTRRFWLLCVMIITLSKSWSQENIPIGTWRLHLSYNNLDVLALSSEHVYAACEIGIMIFDKSQQQITTVSKSDGLSSSIISAMAYDPLHSLLIIAHENGLLSILDGNEITSYNSLVISTAISGSRRINHITINGSLAYLSTDFGVVVFDIDKRVVRETYRDLGESGATLKINQSVIFMDSLYVATKDGVLSGSLDGITNLLDFRNWNRYNQSALNNDIKAITVFNNGVYAAINTLGIYRLQNGIWSLQSYLQSESFQRLSTVNLNLVITTSDKVWMTDGAALTEIGEGLITSPDDAVQDENDIIWIADGRKGLISVNVNSISYLANGPSANTLWRISYSSNKIINCKGGFTNSLQPLNRNLNVDQFINGQWSALPASFNTDITDFAQISDVSYISSYSNGLERIASGATLIFDDTNSPLTKISPSDQFVPITSIEEASEGLWVANYGVSSSLHFLYNDITWQSFSLAPPQAQYPIELLVDKLGQIWMIIDPLKGGGIIVFNKDSGLSTYLTTQAGKGGLPSSTVRSLANDRTGQVWIGTNQGVVYISNPASVFDGSVDAVRPIFENRFLLNNEAVTTIAVDGGNRKWMGTDNGVWLFNPTGEGLIYNFTEESSPILSNKIIDITIEPKSGEVFFATDKGLASFRSAATESELKFSDVKIFPNPVSADFNGQVAINGLYTDAIVKITDMNGRLVWQTNANGGTATWNARQLNGSRVSTGMYLVFATAEDGSERHVGKIAVIE